MIEIAIKVCGDHWVNPDHVEQMLRQVPKGAPVMINMSTEGASMTALGVSAMIDRYVDAQRVWVRSWANTVDQVPYQRAEQHFYSHFFWMAQRYWDQVLPATTHERRFACMIGRLTWPRVRMLHDLMSEIGDHCLFSLMDRFTIPREDAHNLDKRKDWMPDDFDHAAAFESLVSLDGHQVRDQYDPKHNTNLSILSHYHRFDVEIVAETYCFGPAFLPTEKTIRPLLYRRPVMIYGPRYFLRRLREQGFQTWSTWWDESYDALEGPARWQAMLEQIRILDRCDHFDAIYHDYQTVLDHNRARAREIGIRHQPQ